MVELGADVNAVNDKDEMPLSITKAEIEKVTGLQRVRKEAAITEEEVKEVFKDIPGVGSVSVEQYKAEEKKRLDRLIGIHKMLGEKGAKERWRS